MITVNWGLHGIQIKDSATLSSPIECLQHRIRPQMKCSIADMYQMRGHLSECFLGVLGG